MAICASCSAELPEGARFCPACGAPAETRATVEERKLATVLFADLVDSTARAGEQDPERTRAQLERFYDAMASEIDAAGGTVEKFAGDAVMAAFGAPTALEDHAERALHAALAMQRRLRSLFGHELGLRIGVNSGEVVVGRPREGSSFVSGDAVNCAARLEQAAQAGEVLAGERTAALARGAFEFGEARTHDAKGKQDGLIAVPVLRALSLMRPRGVGGLRRAFVGRDSELELLVATYARAVRQSDPHLVTIMADVGVGKTRLVRELWQRLGAESPEPLRRTGRCLAYGEGITYWPLGEILKEHLGILESDSPEAVRERLGDRQILGLTLGLDVSGDLHPLAARDRLHDAWVEFLEGLAAERPIVLLVEDLHWAEEPLLDLLDRLVREVRGPLFVIGTARPELLDARPSWSGGTRNASQLWLEPLTAEDSVRMLDELLAKPLPPELRDVVVERAEGNPFFVEELIGTLIDRGVLERHGEEWRARDLPEGFAIPDSIQAVVAARMDLLSPTEKAALQAAAVAGRIFWGGPLVELLDGVEPDFVMLEDRDFIRRRSGSTFEGEREYVFKHALTREVAYASLPKARRARLHARFGEWLAGLGKDQELAPLLAHHYAEAVRAEDADLAWADEPERLEALRREAARWLRRAADLAVQRYELAEGRALLRRALEHEGSTELQAEIWRAIGRAHALGFEGEQFWTAMQRSLELGGDAQTQAGTYSELALQTTGRAGMWTKAPDRDVVSSWIERALELAEPRSAERAKALVAKVFWHPDGAASHAAEASAIAEEVGDPELRMSAFTARVTSAYSARRYNEALTWAERAYVLRDELTDPDLVSDLSWLGIPPCVAVGRFREARRLASEYYEQAIRLTPHHRVHAISIPLEVEELIGAWNSVAERTEEVERLVADNVDTPCVRNGRLLLLTALAHGYLGDDVESRRLVDEAGRFPAEGYETVLAGPRIRLALLRGDLEGIQPLLRIDLSANRWWQCSNVPARLDALVTLGDREGTEELGQSALETAPYLEPFALRALGQVRGDRSLIEQALERFEAMRLEWHAEQTRGLLAS